MQTVRQRWVEWYRHLHNLEVFKLHDDLNGAFKRLRISEMLTSNAVLDSEESEDADGEQKYAILQEVVDENGVISEEEEGAEYDGEGQADSEELPLIRDVDRSKFGVINQSDLQEEKSWEEQKG